MSIMAKLFCLFSILPGRGRARAAPDLVDASSIADPFERAVADFQRHIERSKKDSTAFLGKELYIYLHLIRSWFKYLSLKHQNDPETIQSMKENYLEYIWRLKEMQISRFMFVKGEAAEKYKERYASAKKAKEEIEYAFAAALGDEAVLELETVKNLPGRCFNRDGDKAPEGYQFDKYGTSLENMAQAVDPAPALERAGAG